MNNIIRPFALIIFTLIFSLGGAQDLKLKIDVIAIEGEFEDVEINIFTCDPDVPHQNITASHKHKIYLPAGNTYFLTYNAPEFIAKTIQIDIPDNLPSNTAIEYQMNMFPQIDGDVNLAYDKPVGYISFDRWFNVKVDHEYDVKIINTDTFEPLLSSDLSGL